MSQVLFRYKDYYSMALISGMISLVKPLPGKRPEKELGVGRNTARRLLEVKVGAKYQN